jgi:hypothetical protein
VVATPLKDSSTLAFDFSPERVLGAFLRAGVKLKFDFDALKVTLG